MAEHWTTTTKLVRLKTGYKLISKNRISGQTENQSCLSLVKCATCRLRLRITRANDQQHKNDNNHCQTLCGHVCPAWNLFKFLQFASQVGITRFSLRGVGFVWFATMLGKYNKLPLWMECVQRWYCYEGELVSLGVRFIIMHVPDGMSKIGQMKSNLAFLYILND